VILAKCGGVGRRPEDGGSCGRWPGDAPAPAGAPPESGPPGSRIQQAPSVWGRLVMAATLPPRRHAEEALWVAVSRPGVWGRADRANASLRALPQPAGHSKRWGDLAPGFGQSAAGPTRNRRATGPLSEEVLPRRRCAVRSQMTQSVSLPPSIDALRKGHSITASARPSNAKGNVIPSAFADFRLRTNSILVACCTGKSAGFSPLRIRPT
jgi:hypothetical protein